MLGFLPRHVNKLRWWVTSSCLCKSWGAAHAELAYLWARKYDRELSSLLVVQAEIAQEIADEIQLTLGDHGPQTQNAMSSLSPPGYRAYDLYLKGQYSLSKRTIPGFQQAIEYFQQTPRTPITHGRMRGWRIPMRC
jgi:hypothetical protein